MLRPHRTLYRVRQVFLSLGARPRPEDLTALSDLLTPALRTLFDAMSPRDQWHSLRTLRLLEQTADAGDDLRIAAVLHDVGKGYVHLHERVIYVLLAPFPGLLRTAGPPGSRGLRGAIRRLRLHAETGAELAAATGAPAGAVTLIRRHHQPAGDDRRQAALQRADDLA